MHPNKPYRVAVWACRSPTYLRSLGFRRCPPEAEKRGCTQRALLGFEDGVVVTRHRVRQMLVRALIVCMGVLGCASLMAAPTGKPLHKIRGHNGTVRSLAFSPNGKILVSGSTDETIRVWDAQSSDNLHTLDRKSVV